MSRSNINMEKQQKAPTIQQKRAFCHPRALELAEDALGLNGKGESEQQGRSCCISVKKSLQHTKRISGWQSTAHRAQWKRLTNEGGLADAKDSENE
jgi:hypothetical protein